jgi:hypothetical protein
MTQELPERHEPENGHFFIEDLDAEAFATWLREAYERSRFKTLTEVSGRGRIEQSYHQLALNQAGYASQTLIIPPHPPKRPKNVAEFLQVLSSLGDFEFSGDLSKFTEDDFQELLERIAVDVEITVRRKK